MRYLSDDDLRSLSPAESATLDTPIPTQMISNGEFTPLPQSEDQRRVFREQATCLAGQVEFGAFATEPQRC